MLVRKKRRNTTESVQRHYAVGLNAGSYDTKGSDVTSVTGCLTQMNNMDSPDYSQSEEPGGSLLHTHGSAQESKGTTFKDNLTLFLRSVPEPRPYLKSVQRYQSEGHHCSPYLNGLVWEKYPILQSQIRTVLAAFHSTSSNGTVSETEQVSWLSVTKVTPLIPATSQNCAQIFSPLLTVFPVNYTHVEDGDVLTCPEKAKKTPPVKTITRILTLTDRQKSSLVAIGKAANLVWNRAVEAYQRLRVCKQTRRCSEQWKQKVFEKERVKHFQMCATLEKQGLKKIKPLLKEVAKATKEYTKTSSAIETLKAKEANRKRPPSLVQAEKVSERLQSLKVCKRSALKKIRRLEMRITFMNKDKAKKLNAEKQRYLEAKKKISVAEYVPPTLNLESVRNNSRISNGQPLTPKEFDFFYVELKKHVKRRTLLDRPMDAMALGVKAVLKAQRTKKVSTFTVKKRGRKNNIVATFNKRDFDFLVKPENLGQLMSTQGTISSVPSEFKIMFNRSRRQWTIVWTEKADVCVPTKLRRESLAGTDPGGAICETMFGIETGTMWEMGVRSDLETRIYPLQIKAQYHERCVKRISKHGARVQSNGKRILEKLEHRQLRSHKFHAQRLRARCLNRITDAHCKLAKYMCERAEVILVPDFKVSNMTRKNKSLKPWRKELLAWSHYKLKQRLIQTASRMDTTIIRNKEYYTTVTCASCHRFGSCNRDREFECAYADCGIRVPRDRSGAINNTIISIHPQ